MTELKAEEKQAKIEAYRKEAILEELGLDRPFDYQKAFEAWTQAAELGDAYSEKRCQELLARGYVQEAKEVIASRKNRKILVIDDDGDFSYALFKVLHADGYDVVTAENGAAAMKLIALHPDISLVILDLKMDQMNGFQFLRHLRALNVLEGIPIVVCTAFANPQNLQDLAKYKIAACATKPIDAPKLLEVIKNTLFKPNQSTEAAS